MVAKAVFTGAHTQTFSTTAYALGAFRRHRNVDVHPGKAACLDTNIQAAFTDLQHFHKLAAVFDQKDLAAWTAMKN